MPRRARTEAPGGLYHIVIRVIERNAIFKDDTDREDFVERPSGSVAEDECGCNLAGIDLSAVIAAECRNLGIEEKELAWPTIRVEITRARSLPLYVATQNLSIS